jgi:hypothetical protein
LCQYWISEKVVINQLVKNFTDFRFRAICMNGHRASCILRYSRQLFQVSLEDKDRLGWAKFLFGGSRLGIQNFSNPACTVKEWQAYFPAWHSASAYRAAAMSGSYEE